MEPRSWINTMAMKGKISVNFSWNKIYVILHYVEYI